MPVARLRFPITFSKFPHLGLKQRDVSLLNSLSYSTFKPEVEHAMIKAAKAARKKHAEATKGKSRHQEGQPDE